MIIGISGKVGTGKSHVAKFLKRKLKFELIDADKIKNNLMQAPNTKDKLVTTFGPRVLHRNGDIDRNKISLISSKDSLRLQVLSEYLDVPTGEEIKEILRENDDNYIIESTDPIRQGISNLFDVSILVVTPKRTGYERLLRKYPKDSINNLWKWQKDVKNYDYVIENKDSIADLRKDIDQLIFEMFHNDKNKE